MRPAGREGAPGASSTVFGTVPPRRAWSSQVGCLGAPSAVSALASTPRAPEGDGAPNERCPRDIYGQIVDDLCLTVHIFVKHRRGDVTAISVGFPTTRRGIGRRISERLAEFGLEGVTVYVKRFAAKPVLLTVEFNP